MEKQGFEEKEELKSRLESTMEEKFKLEKVRKLNLLIDFPTLTYTKTECAIFRTISVLFKAVTPTVPTSISIIFSNFRDVFPLREKSILTLSQVAQFTCIVARKTRRSKKKNKANNRNCYFDILNRCFQSSRDLYSQIFFC